MIINFRYAGYGWSYELYNSRLLESKLNFSLSSTLEVIFHFLILSSLLMLRGAPPFVLIVSMFLLKLSLNSKFIITLCCSPCHGAFEVFEFFFNLVLIWFSSFLWHHVYFVLLLYLIWILYLFAYSTQLAYSTQF